jgi:hypothetical protein
MLLNFLSGILLNLSFFFPPRTPAPPQTRWKHNGENLHRFGEEFEHKTEKQSTPETSA